MSIFEVAEAIGVPSSRLLKFLKERKMIRPDVISVTSRIDTATVTTVAAEFGFKYSVYSGFRRAPGPERHRKGGEPLLETHGQDNKEEPPDSLIEVFLTRLRCGERLSHAIEARYAFTPDHLRRFKAMARDGVPFGDEQSTAVISTKAKPRTYTGPKVRIANSWHGRRKIRRNTGPQQRDFFES